MMRFIFCGTVPAFDKRDENNQIAFEDKLREAFEDLQWTV